jgi:hypothetical protein
VFYGGDKMEKLKEQTTNQQTTQPKTEHATNPQPTTKNQYSNLVPRAIAYALRVLSEDSTVLPKLLLNIFWALPVALHF